MPKPSSAPGEHCLPCGLTQLDTGEPRSYREHALESYLVDRFVNDIQDGNEDIDRYDVSDKPQSVQRRYEAAKTCASMIVNGECQAFSVLRHLDGGYAIAQHQAIENPQPPTE